MTTHTDLEIAAHYNTVCIGCSELINCHGLDILDCTGNVMSRELVLNTEAVLDCMGYKW